MPSTQWNPSPRHKKWWELTNEEREAQGAWDRSIDNDIDDGIGLVVPLDTPIRCTDSKGVTREAKWLFICFYGFLQDPQKPDTYTDEGNHGWLPDRHAPNLPVDGISDRNHCVGFLGPDGNRWVQLGGDPDVPPIDGDYYLGLGQADATRLLGQAETIMKGLVDASKATHS